jgi:hypothetical protein
MIKTFTFVKRRPALTREAFFVRWCEHTRDWDLKDHPECSLNRLVLVTDSASPYDGIAETHWPDAAALAGAIAFYATASGQSHWADLQSFMDIDNSPTVTVEHEAEVSTESGIRLLSGPPPRALA